MPTEDAEGRYGQRKQNLLRHEYGQGSKCTVCRDKCPGLEPHFWRKICINCKCALDDHELPAEFEGGKDHIGRIFGPGIITEVDVVDIAPPRANWPRRQIVAVCGDDGFKPVARVAVLVEGGTLCVCPNASEMTSDGVCTQCAGAVPCSCEKPIRTAPPGSKYPNEGPCGKCRGAIPCDCVMGPKKGGKNGSCAACGGAVQCSCPDGIAKKGGPDNACKDCGFGGSRLLEGTVSTLTDAPSKKSSARSSKTDGDSRKLSMKAGIKPECSACGIGHGPPELCACPNTATTQPGSKGEKGYCKKCQGVAKCACATPHPTGKGGKNGGPCTTCHGAAPCDCPGGPKKGGKNGSCANCAGAAPCKCPNGFKENGPGGACAGCGYGGTTVEREDIPAMKTLKIAGNVASRPPVPKSEGVVSCPECHTDMKAMPVCDCLGGPSPGKEKGVCGKCGKRGFCACANPQPTGHAGATKNAGPCAGCGGAVKCTCPGGPKNPGPTGACSACGGAAECKCPEKKKGGPNDTCKSCGYGGGLALLPIVADHYDVGSNLTNRSSGTKYVPPKEQPCHCPGGPVPGGPAGACAACMRYPPASTASSRSLSSSQPTLKTQSNATLSKSQPSKSKTEEKKLDPILATKYAFLPGVSYQTENPSDVVSRYMEELPPESRPTKENTKRQERLVHQIPQHDLTPSHPEKFSPEEKKQFENFMNNTKSKAVGQGMVESKGPGSQFYKCQGCKKDMKAGDVAVVAPARFGADAAWHPACFKCCVCDQILADLIYFTKDGKLYCGRHYGEANHPRCFGCDELIFQREYTMAENKAYHLHHFCCFNCDLALGGHRYMLKEERPHCLGCYDKLFAKICITCKQKIAADQQKVSCDTVGAAAHWHANPACFKCMECAVYLLDKGFIFKFGSAFCNSACRDKWTAKNPQAKTAPTAPTPSDRSSAVSNKSSKQVSTKTSVKQPTSQRTQKSTVSLVGKSQKTTSSKKSSKK